MLADYQWHDFVGNLGVVCVVGTYALLQLNRLDDNHPLYSLLNGVGAMLLAASIIVDFNLSAFVLQIVWLFLSGYGLWKALVRQGTRLRRAP